MIQEKLKFSEGSSLIERKCLCCKQFSHRFSFCPKLHFIADKEKIIKKMIFSSSVYNRTSFTRKGKKSNALITINDLTAKKQALILEIPKVNLMFEQNLECLSILNSLQECDGQEFEEKKEEEFNKISSKSIKREEGEIENENNIKINNGKKIYSHYNSLESGKKQFNVAYSLINQNKCYSEDATSEIQEKTNEFRNDNNESKQNLKADILYFFFEKVHNYKNYFPDSNIDIIVKNQKIKKKIFTECNHNKILEKYKNFKFYSFYSNSLNEILIKESKGRVKQNSKESRPIDNNICLLKNENLNITENDSKQIRLSPLRKKTFFDIPKKIDTKKSIQDLILMIKSKEADKKKTKS